METLEMTWVRQTQQEVVSCAGFQPKLGPSGGWQDEELQGVTEYSGGPGAEVPSSPMGGACRVWRGPGGPTPTWLMSGNRDRCHPRQQYSYQGKAPRYTAPISSSVKRLSILGDLRTK